MKKIVINGGRPLKGEITISGAKNSVVALIPAIILSDDVVILDCVPDISDVASLVDIMEIMGASVKRYDDVLEIDPRGVQNKPMPYGKINSLRASYYFYGSLLGRFGEATVGLPGGCDLGPRPIDLHLKAFEAMGAKTTYEGDNMNLSTNGSKLQGASIYMDTVSVGATINTMLAAVKAQGRTVIENAAREPEIIDVASLIEIMEIMGASVKRYDDVLEIDPRGVQNKPMPYGKINSLRASYYFYGSLLGRFGQATVGLPGGCDLGPRPIDLHLKAFEAMGAKTTYEGDNMNLSTNGSKLQGASIYMDTVSVGATINTMLAAVKAQGRTVIENAAREPEIIDVATLLNNMGGHIRGAGTDMIIIDGVESLHGTRHQVIPDRIEAGTYISMAAAVGQGIRINNVLYEHLEAFIAKLEEMGVHMTVSEDSIFVEEQTNLKAVNIKTAPYPGFATDLQQPITPLLLKAEGRGTLIDTIYEKRVNHVFELAKMNADISTTNDHIIYKGGNPLHGASVRATDLRAGAALVIAGLMAEGRTEITSVEFILRGYSNIIEKLRKLGADIELIED